MAWRRPGDKPLSKPMMVSLPTHICVTRPQWVKGTTVTPPRIFLGTTVTNSYWEMLLTSGSFVNVAGFEALQPHGLMLHIYRVKVLFYSDGMVTPRLVANLFVSTTISKQWTISYLIWLPLALHICVAELGQHWFIYWLVPWSTPSLYCKNYNLSITPQGTDIHEKFKTNQCSVTKLNLQVCTAKAFRCLCVYWRFNPFKCCSFLWKINMCCILLLNIMPVDGLATQGARASTVMILTHFAQIIRTLHD